MAAAPGGGEHRRADKGKRAATGAATCSRSNEQIPNGAVPDAVLPFQITHDATP
ncbi:MAG: hypothetical protein R2713_22655 [Ilumatobacteraceae bacterium]